VGATGAVSGAALVVAVATALAGLFPALLLATTTQLYWLLWFKPVMVAVVPLMAVALSWVLAVLALAPAAQ
jgi:hypothetical protein